MIGSQVRSTGSFPSTGLDRPEPIVLVESEQRVGDLNAIDRSEYEYHKARGGFE
jgi:hypothetical protein